MRVRFGSTLVLLLAFLPASLSAAPPRSDLAGAKLEFLPTVNPTCAFPRFTGTLRIEVRNQGADLTGASQGLVFEDLDWDFNPWSDD